jgi:Ser/Thr protein kinase RdoA (MazF antagonist)
MDEQDLQMSLQQVLAEQYRQAECSFHSLNTRTLDDERIVYKMYRADLPDHASWVICAAHDDLSASHTFRWESQGTTTTWLEGRAHILMTLASQGYPAPRVIPTQSSTCVVKSGAWSILVTTWLAGQNSQFQPEPLAQAGALLARLHLLPLEELPSQPARWNSSYSLPHAIRALEEARASIPSSYLALYQECHATLRMMVQALPALPETFIHGDCWMQNAVVADAGIALIDWEGAGRGAAILDLADFLLRSQCDAYGAPPDTLRLEAAVSGYASHRLPNDDELDLLALAARFSSAWRAAWMLAHIRAEGWTPRLEHALARVQATYGIAEPTASLARSAFHRFRQPVS